MNKPLFIINYLGAQDKSPRYDRILSKNILDDICIRLFSESDYDVKWIKERNVGRLITCEFNGSKIYVNLTREGEIVGRNSYLQSVTTAYQEYFKNRSIDAKYDFTDFFVYFLPFKGNNQTDYHKFMYKIMSTAGIKFLNPDFGLKGYSVCPFHDVQEIIKSRMELRKQNSHNDSTYLTEESDGYYIYGKTYGANEKETTLMYLAISAISDKPIKLFEIMDSDSTKLSDSDTNLIKMYSRLNGVSFEICDDTYPLNPKEEEKYHDNLRNPRFNYNLLGKYGPKKCALCGCDIGPIVEAAHIFPVSEIRKLDISDSQKEELANDGDNGIFLCKNHHKLYDDNYIWLDDNGNLHTSQDLDQEKINYIGSITKFDHIDPQFLNIKMQHFIDGRLNVYSQK